MIQVERSIIIDRPIEEVFAYVSDLRNAPERSDSGILVSRISILEEGCYVR